MTIQWSVEVHDSLKSTQDLAKGYARLQHEQGKVVQANRQEGGYGRHGRQWISEAGNLYLSLLLKPDCPVRDITQLSLVTSLALIHCAARCIDNEELLMLKWPNDLLIAGKKCAGIILETELADNGTIDWVVIGVGLNIASAPPGLGDCLQAHSAKPLIVNQCRDILLECMAQEYAFWMTHPFDKIKERWLSKAHPRDTPLEIKIGPQLERGLFHGLDSSGNLILRDRDFRTKIVTAGEVFFPQGLKGPSRHDAGD
jgi:BirA family biotin operon repressor/biotin-[acetyl-CoA-carboxylase] ligase